MQQTSPTLFSHIKQAKYEKSKSCSSGSQSSISSIVKSEPDDGSVNENFLDSILPDFEEADLESVDTGIFIDDSVQMFNICDVTLTFSTNLKM